MECSICYEPLSETRKLGCNHVFHSKCVDDWIETKGTCPVCRFQEKEIPIESNSEEEEEWLSSDSYHLFYNIYSMITQQAIWLSTVQNYRTVSQIYHNLDLNNRFTNLCTLADMYVVNVRESETHYQCEIENEFYECIKDDVDLVKSQTNESIERCLYFLKINEGDIVDTILEMLP